MTLRLPSGQFSLVAQIALFACASGPTAGAAPVPTVGAPSASAATLHCKSSSVLFHLVQKRIGATWVTAPSAEGLIQAPLESYDLKFGTTVRIDSATTLTLRANAASGAPEVALIDESSDTADPEDGVVALPLTAARPLKLHGPVQTQALSAPAGMRASTGHYFLVECR